MRLEARPHVDDALVRAAAESEAQVALRDFKAAVDQDVEAREEFALRGGARRRQGFPREAGVGRDLVASVLEQGGESREGFRLEEGIAAGESDAPGERAAPDFGENVLRAAVDARAERVRLRIVAAGAVEGAALGEDDETQPGAVDDGIGQRSREVEERRGRQRRRGGTPGSGGAGSASGGGREGGFSAQGHA